MLVAGWKLIFIVHKIEIIMFNVLKELLGFGPKVDISSLLQKGAIIVDVRSPGEYAGGHSKGSVNIPLDSLRNNLKKLPDKEKPIITCCASGARSSSAKSFLKSQGYTNVHNGGSWYNVKQ